MNINTLRALGLNDEELQIVVRASIKEAYNAGFRAGVAACAEALVACEEELEL